MGRPGAFGAAVLAWALAGAAGDAIGKARQSSACDGPGALVGVTMKSRVGVLLDEVPRAMRDRVVERLLAKPPDFWIARAHAQIRLTTYRLVFREPFYPDEQRQQLPLPPESVWEVALRGRPGRTRVGKHDLVTVRYAFSSTVLTDCDSPGTSEPKLRRIGGRRKEVFTLPIDPELLFQRTRFACMDEAQFPPHSVDSDQVDSFYDDMCDVEPVLTNTGCHQTELPSQSCVGALKAKVGRVQTAVRFKRLRWDQIRADRVRVGPITNLTGADLQVEEAEFRPHRVVYRYIPPDSCALVERCVGGPGWRRLLQFSTADRNTGAKNLEIGLVDYFIDGGGTPLSDHHIFEYSACHHHYHFTHYGEFSFGGDEATTAKRGFCLQSTGRFSNNEVSPLHNPYGDCHFQGIAAGWVDQYKIGLDCQWIDVTAVDTSQGPVTRSLRFTSNPDGFLCEGTPVLDAQGNPVFEPTEFRTDAGETVDRPGCDFAPEWSANNTAMYDVTLPPDGESDVTAPCPTGRLGPLRNCGFATQADLRSCAPGSSVSLRCTIAAGAAPQVTRVCGWSAVLGIAIPCTYEDSLLTATVGEEGVDMNFTCPSARSAVEPGGSYALFTAPVFEEDPLATVSCTPR